MTAATREMTFLLAVPERRLLRGLARRLPRPIHSDHLSALGVLGAVGTGAGYALSIHDLRWLWLASGMLVVNWLGDSLDGTLARVRNAERPRYGYYLDHLVDAFNTIVVGVGLGLSPFVNLEMALGLVVVYLLLSVNVYLESNVFGVFRMAYGRVGPTEGRIALILANVGFLAGAGTGLVDPGAVSALGNAVFAGLGGGVVVMLVVRSIRNLRHLAALEPPVRSTD